ncbi:CRISPR-associated endonuclease Cas2 [Companilactobacillus insicii]|uniref:CRISPR-associated endonuclease Cas2 n=1 Tax=Companilactobacillus insicii TaxID=1732567 RepID=UPI001FEA4E4D|nr:CRISPR-associated endonuclease Cas2 [Companilactobacillus insicii]
MRLMIMFDLPTLTSQDRRNYRQFIKNINNDGFSMIQESIYTCILIDKAAVNFLVNKIRLYAPTKGLIQALPITEKQFEAMVNICGKKDDKPENKFTRLVII